MARNAKTLANKTAYRGDQAWATAGKGRWTHASGAAVEVTGQSSKSGRKYIGTRPDGTREHAATRDGAMAWAESAE